MLFAISEAYKKKWIPTAVVPRYEAFALPISLEQQREAHAEYKHSPCHIVKVRVGHINIHERRTQISTEG